MLIGHPNSGKIGYEMTLKPLEEYFTTVYYDPRGTGQSEAPKTVEAYSPQYIVTEIEQLRKKLGVEKIWLFGHSDQSAIALSYTLRFPEHVAGLILSGTSHIGDLRESYARRKKSEVRRAAESPWFAQVLEDIDVLYTDKIKDQPGRDLTDAPMKWWCFDEASAQKIIPVSKAVSQAGRRKPIGGAFYAETDAERQSYLEDQKQFLRIQVPVLIVNGTADTNNPPEYARQLQQSLPQGKLILVEKSGHFPWVENPDDTFAAIKNWLGKR